MSTLDKAASLLSAIAAEPEGARLRDLVVSSGMPPSSVHRLLTNLEGLGLARRHAEDKRYRVGAVFMTLAHAGRRQWPLEAITRPVLGRLSRQTGATSYLSVVSGLDALCVLRVEGSSALRAVTLQEGTRRPLGTGAGSMALLATLDDAELERVIAANALPVEQAGAGQDPVAVREGVAATRARGYASHSGQLVPGVDGIGVAAHVMGVSVGISISFVGELTGARERSEYVGFIREAAGVLSAAHG